jgi:hypothetical protein
MAFSFLYLAVRALLGALVRSRRGLDVKDVELLVLRHELAILRRQVARPQFRMADRALLAAAAVHLPRPQRTPLLVTPRTVLRWHRALVRRKCRQRPGRVAEFRAPHSDRPAAGWPWSIAAHRSGMKEWLQTRRSVKRASGLSRARARVRAGQGRSAHLAPGPGSGVPTLPTRPRGRGLLRARLRVRAAGASGSAREQRLTRPRSVMK